MINLRYHIVSLTAVFLAIGIGVTLGSTFLDRATVENLNGQLENLETRLGDRDQQIDELQAELDEAEAVQSALDEQGAGLLSGQMDATPVLVVAAEGVDEADVDRAVQTLQVAGAEVHGLWWLSERLQLADDAAVDDLATALDEPSQDPARLRRLAVDALGGELRARQLEQPPGVDDVPTGEEPADPEAGEGVEPGTADDQPTQTTTADDTDVDDTAVDDAEADELGGASALPVSEALVEAGFLTVEALTDGAEDLEAPPGVRLVIVGGSSVLPDDIFVQPLVERLTRGTSLPTLTVVSSAMTDPTEVAEVVSVVRADDRLRSMVSTVDSLDHFQGWMALALAVDDLGDRTIGHYGLGEDATGLLPPLQAP